MVSWAKICDILDKYAKCDSEINYQKSLVDLLLEDKLGWNKNQIKEQPSIPLGATERAIPDILVSKDNHNKFVIEVKKPDHVKTQKNIDQLVSYMKLLEVSVGVYIGRELDVFYKNIGDGLEPKLVLTLEFNPDDDNGEKFVSLFTESAFSVENVYEVLKERESKLVFETEVKNLTSHILSLDFQEELRLVLRDYFSDKDSKVVDEVLNSLVFDIHPIKEYKRNSNSSLLNASTISAAHTEGILKCGRDITAREYAKGLVKQIIEKNSSLGFKSLYEVFGRKNYIEDRKRIEEHREKRWFLNENDVIKIADGTSVVISNQWGFKNNSKDKMEHLRKIANKYGIDDAIPD